MRQIHITRTDTGTALVLALSGEIDLATTGALAQRLEGVAAAVPPPRLVVLDLTGVGFLSGSGLRMVHAFAAACAERGVRVRVVAAPGGIAGRVLNLVPNAFTPRLRVYDTLPQALHSLDR